MRPLYRQLLVSLMLCCPAIAALGQDRPQLDFPTTPKPLTGKERLGQKWMDEQRIDNCNVPVDKRGSKPRSSTCPNVPVG